MSSLLHQFGNHPLDGAFLRWMRADIHLAEAAKLMDRWGEECVDKIVRQDDGKHRFDGFPVVPPILPVVVGDVIHNLRASLDYLIYELSIWDTNGLIKDRTQFPIEGSDGDDPVVAKCRFNGRRESYLKGLNDRHASMIERLQPYNGIEWTETLRDISNPDKHRHLSVLTRDGQVIYTIRRHPDGRFTEKDFDVRSVGLTTIRFDVEVHGQEAILIAIPKRGEAPLMGTLRRLEAEACGVLEAFKPEFKTI